MLRKSIISAGLTLLFVSAATNSSGVDFAPIDSFKVYYLEFDGLFKTSEEECMYGVKIEVYTDSFLFHTTRSRHTGKNAMKLPLNHVYTIVF